ncbi:recombinase family protein [Sphingomonas sp. LB-2]|uniref:recombinase family protein n=1 Tax=Sphingomonas caeni TaxID=2984949 RepID=UPI00222FCDFD|nr:recombinase family protein [Sphingomonas caeni]MCW3847359.1 recombinase family protein [Sphingomonas caeni]
MAGKLVGYARTASTDGDINGQIDQLRAAGCQIVHSDEGVSGLSTEHSALADAIAELGVGDTLLVCDLARLSRDAASLQLLANDVKAKGAAVRTLDDEQSGNLDRFLATPGPAMPQ